MRKVRVIDSHTGGEPTRVVLPGEIDLMGQTLSERRADLLTRWDGLRSGLVNEPRGSEVWVGAVLTPPVEPGSETGVVFFNDVGGLGMCGHGTLGVVETLRHLGRIRPGPVRLDTPVGTVEAVLEEDGMVALTNVESFRHAAGVQLTLEGIGEVVGDVAYGGNWFFLVQTPRFEISLARATELTEVCWRIRRALREAKVTGRDGAEIDHVELFTPGPVGDADSMNFVQCPGGAYDRSPCGTGTSAKLACLFADGKLAEGAVYRQASVTGSVFEGSVQPSANGVIPTLRGKAHVTAEATLIFRDDDPLRDGLR